MIILHGFLCVNEMGVVLRFLYLFSTGGIHVNL